MRFAATILLALTVLIPLACSSDDPVEPGERRVPGALAIVGGNGQGATVGTPLADAFETDRLVVGGYLHGSFAGMSDVDVYRIAVPAGQYTFETSGWLGACLYAGEADTVLELYDDNGILIASNNDIDVPEFNYCSRITQTLQAGTYEIRVMYFAGGALYRLQARSGT